MPVTFTPVAAAGGGLSPAVTRTRRPAGGLEGTSALVTGGGSGIGLATAVRLAADGAQVTDLRADRGQKLREAAATIDRAAAGSGRRGRAAYVVADVTVEDEIAAAVGGRRPRRPAGSTSSSPAPAAPHHMGPMLEADAGGGPGHRRAQPHRLVPLPQARRGGDAADRRAGRSC